MRVAELRSGMLLKPKPGWSWFHPLAPWGSALKWIKVINTDRIPGNPERPIDFIATYAGNRKEMSLEKRESFWSARFVLAQGEIYAVDPNAWRNMESIK